MRKQFSAILITSLGFLLSACNANMLASHPSSSSYHTAATALAAPSFAQNVRVGLPTDDDWEPSILADKFGHLYSVWYSETRTHLYGQRSDDGGNTWTTPVQIAPNLQNNGGEADPWMGLAADGKTVWVSYMNGANQVRIEAVTTQDGVHWSQQMGVSGPYPVGHLDKDVMAINGSNMVVCYDDNTNMYAAVSNDAGTTWNVRTVYTLSTQVVQFMCSGAAIDSAGNIEIASDTVSHAYTTNIRIDRSTTNGASWSRVFSQDGPSPYPCSSCGTGSFYAPQVNIDIGSDNHLYAIYNSAPPGAAGGAANRIYFMSSADGVTWSAPQDVSLAPTGIHHSFATVLAQTPTPGDVRILWEDARTGSWNVFYRQSTDGGATWSNESQVSNYVAGYPYLTAQGFAFPYGDQTRMTLDNVGKIHATWGETQAYTSAGNAWVGNQL